MKFKRMNITLPEPVAKQLAKVSNKSAFIARAVSDRLAALEKDDRRRQLLEAYRYAAANPEIEKDGRADW
jgi:hypothetical protein